MLLAMDVGNSSITLGLIPLSDNPMGIPCFTAKLSAGEHRTADEYAVFLQGILQMHNHTLDAVSAVMICSVVPRRNPVLKAALAMCTDAPVYFVGAGMKTGLTIRLDDPSQTGADLVANAAGALLSYEAPLLIADIGTATTLSAVAKGKNGTAEFLGGCIIPGVRMATDALKQSTALLPEVGLTLPRCAIGRNTADSIRAGTVLGSALLLDSFVDRFLAEMGLTDAALIATGGLCSLILPACRHTFQEEPYLTLRGLYALYCLNRKGKDKTK